MCYVNVNCGNWKVCRVGDNDVGNAWKIRIKLEKKQNVWEVCKGAKVKDRKEKKSFATKESGNRYWSRNEVVFSIVKQNSGLGKISFGIRIWNGRLFLCKWTYICREWKLPSSSSGGNCKSAKRMREDSRVRTWPCDDHYCMSQTIRNDDWFIQVWRLG